MTKKLKFSLNGLTPLLDFLHARIVQRSRKTATPHFVFGTPFLQTNCSGLCDRSPTSLIGSAGSIFSLPGLAIAPSVRKSATRSCKPHSSATTAALPRMERANAFTLAEVLITLGIIGVVAAVTMPTLITKYQKKQTVTQLKKAYAELSQALQIAQKDLGMMEDWDFANFPTSADRVQYFYDNVLKPNLKIVKYCAPSSNDCWADVNYKLTGDEARHTFNGLGGRNSFITASGYSVYYWLHADGTGGWFFVDLNGAKRPNILGKDIFVFQIFSTKNTRVGLHPNGLYYQDSENNMVPTTRDAVISGNYPTGPADGSCSKTGIGSQGYYCAALIMLDGWEIKDDYPW